MIFQFSKSKQAFYAVALLAAYQESASGLPSDLQEISDEEHAALIKAQSAGKHIDWSGEVPVAVDPLAETKEEAIARLDTAIKAERDRRKVGGVFVAGKWIQTDADSCIQFLGLKDKARDILAAGGTLADPIKVLGQNVVWRSMDGTYLPITGQIAFDVVTAKGDLDALAFGRAEQHRAALAASADPASYDYSTGWPAVFAG
jgi:hypothetical protein